MRHYHRIPGLHDLLIGTRRPEPRYPDIPRHLWGDIGLTDHGRAAPVPPRRR